MTFAPGKKQRFAVSGSWDRDLTEDLRILRDRHQADTLVVLLEEHELEELAITDLAEAADKAGIRVTRFPIPDGGTPNSMSDTRALVEGIVRELRDGRTVVVSCKGGLGRTGLVAACALVALGASASQAIAGVHDARGGTIENGAQENFVNRFGQGAPPEPAEDT
ncbi:MAG: tyrosine-protein phosphatase [Chloroflexota bacterium]|nr:tyrosine-protein phosphatase [Chloroflexota bacterium]